MLYFPKVARITLEARERERRAEQEEANAGKKKNKKAKKRAAEEEENRLFEFFYSVASLRVFDRGFYLLRHGLLLFSVLFTPL